MDRLSVSPTQLADDDIDFVLLFFSWIFYMKMLTRQQIVQDLPWSQVCVHDDGGVSGWWGVDVAEGQRLVWGPHSPLLHCLCCGGTWVSTCQEHHLQRPQAWEFIVRFIRLCKTCEYSQSLILAIRESKIDFCTRHYPHIHICLHNLYQLIMLYCVLHILPLMK